MPLENQRLARQAREVTFRDPAPLGRAFGTDFVVLGALADSRSKTAFMGHSEAPVRNTCRSWFAVARNMAPSDDLGGHIAPARTVNAPRLGDLPPTRRNGNLCEQSLDIAANAIPVA